MNKIRLITILTIISIVSGCVDSAKSKLDNRVLDYWNYKISQNYEAAYEFLSPGWKNNEDQEAYAQRMKSSRVNWKTVKILNKKCSETYICNVTVVIEYEYMFKEAMGNKILMPSTLKENWLMQDNSWYHTPVKTKQ